jgi:hypothetical protein
MPRLERRVGGWTAGGPGSEWRKGGVLYTSELHMAANCCALGRAEPVLDDPLANRRPMDEAQSSALD